MKANMLAIIKAHNRMIDTLEQSNMKCELFAGMTVWHKIACEGCKIVSLARQMGIDAKIDMQAGHIYVDGCVIVE